MKFILLPLLLLSLLLTPTLPLCPPSCSCTSNTYSCIQCLQKFKRIYNQSTGSCSCFTSYVQKNPVESYCCPPNCASCNSLGCTSCNSNAESTYNDILESYLCQCVENYELTNGMCLCRASTQPTKYYENKMTDKCYGCPLGCGCDTTGCYKCDQNTNRNVSTDFLGSSSCLCLSPYVEIDGECQCYPGCTCVDGVVLCEYNTSKRVQDGMGNWVCDVGMVEKQNQCFCEEPYGFISATREPWNTQCLCMSYSKPNEYYQAQGECLVCPQGCTCTQKGCVSCNSTLNRQIKHFTCPCKSPYTQFQGVCICVQPYYLSTTNNMTTCQCLSLFNFSGFIWNPQTQQCSSCPAFCKCNQNGCVSCPTIVNRRLVQSGMITYCPCILSAYVFMGAMCKCNDFSVPSAKPGEPGQPPTTICECQMNNQIYSQDGVCRMCPTGCECSFQKGCFSCIETAHRVIKVVEGTAGYSDCICMQGYVEVSNVCTCQHPFTMNFTSGSCQCQHPYIMNGDACDCLSATTPSLFYLDNIVKTCYECPAGCECNQTGCHNCYPYTLRHNFFKDGLWQCPCLQTAVLKYGLCTFCPAGYYFVGGKCVQCPNCYLCNIHGCTQCITGQEMELNKTNPLKVTCDCRNASLVNYNGTCVCPSEQYKDDNGDCQYCPKYCLDCKYQSSKIICNSCRKNSFRYNSPTTDCPCVVGYSQLGKVASYCCPDTCTDCNELGCTQCPLYSFRELKENKCVCVANLIEVEGQVDCGCPQAKYLFGEVCIACPVNCRTCAYEIVTDDVYCRTCYEGMNREEKGWSKCPCLEGFVEANPIQQYCVPKYCAVFNQYCPKCTWGRVPDQSGLKCLCAKGTYQGTYGTCKPCSIAGCLDCTSYSFCIQCDTSNHYYMANTTCKHALSSQDYLYSQSTRGIRLQIRTKVNTTAFGRIYELKASLMQVEESFSAEMTVTQAIDLVVTEARLTEGDTLSMKIDSPGVSLERQVLTVVYVLVPGRVNQGVGDGNVVGEGMMTNTSTFNGLSLQSSIYLKYIYAEHTLVQTNQWQYTLTQTLMTLLLVYHLTLHIRGFKHNQLLFLLQTLSFLGLVLPDPSLHLIPFLHSLRVIYYCFSNALQNIIPQGYMETGFANFSVFTGDANIFRVGGTTIVVAGVVGVMVVLGRLGMVLGRVYCAMSRVMRHRKYGYRALEFFYKTCMYPLMFFSVVAVRNWDGGILASQQYLVFLNLSRGLAATFIGVYTLVTLWSVMFETIAKINKIENLLEYSTCVLNALILTFIAGTNLYLLILFTSFLRVTLYLLSRKKYLRDFQKSQYLSLLGFFLELTTLSILNTHSLPAISLLLTLTLLVYIAHGQTVIFFTNKLARRSKRAGPDEEKDENYVESLEFDRTEEGTEGAGKEGLSSSSANLNLGSPQVGSEEVRVE